MNIQNTVVLYAANDIKDTASGKIGAVFLSVFGSALWCFDNVYVRKILVFTLK